MAPQIRKLMNDFNRHMTAQEASVWQAFVDVVQNFLGNHRSNTYEQIVQSLVSRYREIGPNMSIKLNFLHNHPDRF